MIAVVVVESRGDRMGPSWEELEPGMAGAGIECCNLPGCRGIGRSIVLEFRNLVRAGIEQMGVVAGFVVGAAGTAVDSGMKYVPFETHICNLREMLPLEIPGKSLAIQPSIETREYRVGVEGGQVPSHSP